MGDAETSNAGEQLGQAERVRSEGSARQFEVNRLLGGHAFLGGARFRKKVLDFYGKKFDAVAPECGVDVALLVRICLQAEKLMGPYDRILGASLYIAILGLLSDMPLLVVAAILLAAVTNSAAAEKVRQHARAFSRPAFDYALCASEYAGVEIPAVLVTGLPQRDQNLVLYAGFVPFVGTGVAEGGWSFNCSLSPPPGAGAAQPAVAFDAVELYAHLRTTLERLRIPGMELHDRVYACGSEAGEIDGLRLGIDMRPIQHIPPERLTQCFGMRDTRLRHYLCLQIADWGGEIINTYYVRVVLRANGLYVEFSRFFLYPIAEQYRAVDRLCDVGKLEALERFGWELAAGPFVSVVAAFHQLPDVWRERRLQQRVRRVLSENTFNAGASDTLRERLSGNQLRHYFQRMDEDFNRKLIERNLLDEIANFLEAHHVDSSDIRNRSSTILNNGIIVNGGDIRANAIAVGKGAAATQSAA